MTRKYRILVVDDEPNVLLTYRLILQQKGFEVSTAASSQEARKALAGEGMDLLLCDLSLETQESGFTVIDCARKKHPGMPTVLLTGYASQEAVDRANALQAPILYKPINITELVAAISRLLQESGKPGEAG
jgi:DNA-binding NtrC family response regulator